MATLSVKSYCQKGVAVTHGSNYFTATNYHPPMAVTAPVLTCTFASSLPSLPSHCQPTCHHCRHTPSLRGVAVAVTGTTRGHPWWTPTRRRHGGMSTHHVSITGYDVPQIDVTVNPSNRQSVPGRARLRLHGDGVDAWVDWLDEAITPTDRFVITIEREA